MNPAEPLAFRIERNEPIPDAIIRRAEVSGLDFCDVTGFGELAWADLAFVEGQSPVRVSGPLALTSLVGRVRRAGGSTLADFSCTLARLTDSGIEVLGGPLVLAEPLFVEISLWPLRLLENGTTTTGKRPANATEPLSTPVHRDSSRIETPRAPTAPPLDKRWASAVAESRRMEALAGDEDDIRPARGDIVYHRQFGRCTVAKIDEEHVTLRAASGRHVQLGLAILGFARRVDEEGHRAFDVEVRRQPR